MLRYLINFLLPIPIAALAPVFMNAPWWKPEDYIAVYFLGVFVCFLGDLRSFAMDRAIARSERRKAQQSGQSNSN
jgi:hypothetical protein